MSVEPKTRAAPADRAAAIPPPDPEPIAPQLELPAAVLWHRQEGGLASSVLAALAAFPGVTRIADELLAVLPVAGDPEVFDVAVAAANRLALATDERDPPQLLVFPSTVRWGPREAVLLPDPFLEALSRQPPSLPPRAVHLTTRAAQSLERPHELAPAGAYDSPSGHSFPLVALGRVEPHAPPYRNPELLGRHLRWVPRPIEEDGLGEALDTAEVVRMTGPIGNGKTRLAWEVARKRSAQLIWLSVGSRRAARLAGRDLATQLTQWLGDGSTASPRGLPAEALADRMAALAAQSAERLLVLDGLESASPEEWETIRPLLARGAGRGLHLLLIGRTGTRWPSECRRSTVLHIPPLVGEAEELVARQVLDSLSIPPAVEKRLREAAGGNPFALEEGVIQLASLRQLRRVYGSFFFSGDAGTGYLPSPRWIRHLEAEAARLGEPMPLRLQALAGERVPPDELAQAAERLGAPTATGWQSTYLATQWLRAADGPWGEGVELPSPAHACAMAATLSTETQPLARRALGERMAISGGTAISRWNSYRLLAGSPAGARVLRTVVTSSHTEVPRLELLAALRREVAPLTGRPEEEELEFDLLWALLPLARRVGKLHEQDRELDRAFALAERRGEVDRFLALATLRAEMAQNSGRYREAESLLRQALSAASGRDDRRKGLLVVELGKALLRQARYAEARELLERALEAFVHAGRTGLVATCQFLLGNAAVHDQRFADAERLYRESLLARRASGVPAATAASLSALGALMLARGDYPRALSYYREAEEILAEHGKEGEESFALLGLGRAHARLGDFAAATPWLRRALALREGRDDRQGEAIARLAVAENHYELGQLQTALDEARRAHFDLSLLPEGESRADAEHLLGRILLGMRQLAEADSCLAEAERIHRESGKTSQSLSDLARRLEVAVVGNDVEAISRHAGLLATRLEALGDAPPADEPFDFHLFRAATWLRQHGLAAEDPQPRLERAYAELMRQTSFLEPTQRSRFLFQIRLHREILDAATHAGLSLSGVGATA